MGTLFVSQKALLQLDSFPKYIKIKLNAGLTFC